jgi:hypothetical protein
MNILKLIDKRMKSCWNGMPTKRTSVSDIFGCAHVRVLTRMTYLSSGKSFLRNVWAHISFWNLIKFVEIIRRYYHGLCIQVYISINRYICIYIYVHIHIRNVWLNISFWNLKNQYKLCSICIYHNNSMFTYVFEHMY